MIASGDQSNYGAIYANKIAVTCPMTRNPVSRTSLRSLSLHSLPC